MLSVICCLRKDTLLFRAHKCGRAAAENLLKFFPYLKFFTMLSVLFKVIFTLCMRKFSCFYKVPMPTTFFCESVCQNDEPTCMYLAEFYHYNLNSNTDLFLCRCSIDRWKESYAIQPAFLYASVINRPRLLSDVC